MPRHDRQPAVTVESGASSHVEPAPRAPGGPYGGGELGRASMEIVERLTTGVFFLDASGCVVHANATGRDLVGGDGLSLQMGQLVAAEATERAGLLRAVELAVLTGCGRRTYTGETLRISRPSGARPYEVTVASLPPPPGPVLAGAPRPVAIALVRDPEEQEALQARRVEQDYGLTPAEAALAVAVARGEGLAPAAAALGITVNTAKSELKSVFGKTGVRRQAELVALLAAPVGFRRLGPSAWTTATSPRRLGQAARAGARA